MRPFVIPACLLLAAGTLAATVSGVSAAAAPAAARPVTAGSALASRPGRPPVAYVLNDGVLKHDAGTVTPINTATNRARAGPSR